MKEKLSIGVDFGGTKIKFGLVTVGGSILGETITLPTGAGRKADEIMATMIGGIEAIINSPACMSDQLLGIGIGSPGPLDLKNGIILSPPNLPTLHNFPLKQVLEDHFKLPVELNNDGNCFVLGEAFFGAAQNANYVCGVTLGTGFGCGIVLNRKIFSGATGTAAEVWCSPYLDRTFEEYGSAREVVRIFQRLTSEARTAKEIHDLAQQGNRHAIDAFAEYGKHLGCMLSIIVNLLDPDTIVVGGSVSHAWPFFEKRLLQHLFENINDAPRKHVKCVPAALGDDAGLLGAAALLFS
ncbi:MAG: ROK family protein [candidate division KSB1 bacterium]|nr:ROK family protein [candidate division KSB1 bacterium]MDZ7341240.1 ROK family protein [candidate division KSB1 bacterium]